MRRLLAKTIFWAYVRHVVFQTFLPMHPHQPATPDDRVVVRQGDTLTAILHRRGQIQRLSYIVQINALPNGGNKLHVGETILVPALSGQDASRSSLGISPKGSPQTHRSPTSASLRR